MRRARAFSFGAVLALATALGGAHAGAAPMNAYGFGARASALGGAVTADANDAGALFYNPSGLALAPSSELAVGYRGASPELQTNHEDAGVAGLGSVDAAALGRGQVWGIPVGFGLGLSLTNGHLSRVSTLREDEPRWVLHEPLPELIDLSAGVALRPLTWLALGGGSGFLATTRGGFQVSGTALSADGKGSEYDSQLRHSVDADLASARFLLLGVELSLPRLFAASQSPVDWSLGVSYRGEAKLEQALHGTLTGTVDAGLLQIPVRYDFEAHSLVAFQPRQLVLGLTAQRGLYRLNFDAGFEQWSRYPSPVARSAAHVEAEVPPFLPLALPPNTDLPPQQSAGFHNRFTWRAGLERRVSLTTRSTLALRAGYAYLPSPAPRVSDSAMLIDATEHVFSLGTGVALDRPSLRYLPRGIALDAFALYGHVPNRHLERRGDTVSAQGHTFSAGISLTLALSPSAAR